MISLITNSAEQTKKLGRFLSGYLKPGDVVAMSGELAAGKTTMIQGICEGLNVKEQVKSPTYTLVNEYNGNFPVYHIDCYREHRLNEWLEIGINEYLYNGGVSIIEWADKIVEILPKDSIRIDIYHKMQAENSRNITISAKKEFEQSFKRAVSSFLRFDNV